ncbi:D-glycero-beta-D-manno-heptose 1-phosphate adenylyltransferase [Clavibacter michiganensis]|nr:D-glycero-beta-D-manno-heptose 1-phosphate adenylyltransferase [Clavibacter michiganensis]PPF61860.1 D-glycero-beta-D-manno-heptose 1-phosphate adenylyltransferase [Clavibacter michiganensis]
MSTELRDLLGAARQRRPVVTVVGDVILDRWLRGGVQRVSREAPVPVVEVDEPQDLAGGAANTALNLCALGARVALISAVGDDDNGRTLLRILDTAGVDTSGVLQRAGGTTASKTRIVGADQILVRVDRTPRDALTSTERAELRARLSALPASSSLVVCDYDGGLLDPAEIEWMSAARRPADRIIVDAHDLRRWQPLRPDVVTPNARETAALLGMDLPEGRARVDAVTACAHRVLEASGADSAVVTLDRDGTVAMQDGRATGRTFAHPAPEQQASGAGDTFVAALTVALALDAELAAAARFGQAAADVVVARPDTAVCSLDDLEGVFAGGASTRTLDASELQAILAEERARGRRIVFTNGCFDVIHRGHTTHLRQAKDLGDVLVVALNDDASVRRLKGPERPMNTVADRTAVLEALGCVDYVVVFSGDTPIDVITALEPDVYAKGGDYTPEMLEETAAVRAYGGEVRILDFIPSHSTTELVNRIRSGAVPT